MKTRQLLGPEDFDKFKLLLTCHKKIGGTQALNIESYELIYSKYFDFNENYKIFGYFENNILISSISLAYRDNNTRGRYWMISGLFTTKKYNIFSFNNPEIGLLIKKAFDIAEENAYYEYYYCISAQVSRVYERQIDKNNYIPLQRYDRISLDIVPKNTVPSIDLYFKLMGGKTKPHDIIIKKRVLQEQFRKKII